MIVKRHNDKRSRDEQPASITSHEADGLLGRLGAKTYGVIYADGTHEELFDFEVETHSSQLEAALALLKAFEIYGISTEVLRKADAERLRQQAEQQRQEARDRMHEAFFAATGGFTSANPYYRTFQGRDSHAGRYSHIFRESPPPPPRPTAERTAALDKCRKLKRLADSSTFAGERDNADARRRKLMAQHGILEREL